MSRSDALPTSEKLRDRLVKVDAPRLGRPLARHAFEEELLPGWERHFALSVTGTSRPHRAWPSDAAAGVNPGPATSPPGPASVSFD